AYRSMMPSGSHAAVILFIDLPPSEVDVNVHPAKTEVRFLHENAILSFIRGGVEMALTATQPVTPFPNVLSRDSNSGAAAADRVAKMAAEPSFSTSETRESTRPACGAPPPAHVARTVEHQITGAGAAEFEIPARESIAVFEVDGGFEPINGVKSVVDTGADTD